MTSLSGKTLGKYRIIERLGRGGMADVYKAYHPRLDRFVAIKVLHGYLAEGEEEFLARFEREARAVAALDHRHIVRVYDFDVQDDVYYMVMEYVEGGTLKTKLEELARAGERMPLPEVARLFRQIAQALDHAHQQDMLHRDVKPANVLLDASGRAVLTDFGIARIVSDSQFTMTGALIGTPAYMSPEQGMGTRATAASDIYSLGVILYELLVGQAPFDADTPLGVIHKHIHEPLPMPRAVRPEIPVALEQVVLKALAKEPGDRYQSVAEMLPVVERALIPESVADTVDQSLEGETRIEKSVSARTTQPAFDAAAVRAAEAAAASATVEPPPIEATPPPVVAEPAPAPAKAPTPGKRRRLKPLLIVLAAAGLLVLALGAVIGGVWLFRPATTPDEAACATLAACAEQTEASLAEEDFAGAVEQLDRALELVPDDEHPTYAYLWCQRGDANWALERVDYAAFDFKKCIEWSEGDPALEALRAGAREAIEALQEVRAPAVDEPCATLEICENEVNALMEQGDLEGAILLLDHMLEKAPEEEHPAYAHLWCLRGKANVALERFEKAKSSFIQCVLWAEEDPELAPLREMAEEQLAALGAEPEPAEGVETFDDPNLPGWEYTPEVSVVEGVLRMESGGFATRPGEWGDLRLVFRVRLFTRSEHGGLAVLYRASDAGAYIVALGGDFLALQREAAGGPFAEMEPPAPLPVPPGEWFTFELIVIEAKYEVMIDGKPFVTAEDRNPLPRGGVAFEVLEDATVEIDEVVLEGE